MMCAYQDCLWARPPAKSTVDSPGRGRSPPAVADRRKAGRGNARPGPRVRHGQPLPAFRLADARVQSGQFDVLERGGARKQIETLKNESYFAITNSGQFLLAE